MTIIRKFKKYKNGFYCKILILQLFYDLRLLNRDEDTEYPERDLPIGETARSDSRSEEVMMLKEKISRLESDLGVSNELAERWHLLAEDRLRSMDSTRKRCA